MDSAFTQRRGIPEVGRRLLPAPVRLVDEPGIEALRLRLTSARSRIGQAPGTSKGGNSSKRIRLRVRVAGFSPEMPASSLTSLPARICRRSCCPRCLQGAAGSRPVRGSRADRGSGSAGGGQGRTPGRGQGFQVDQVVKVAVESCAMRAATEFYGQDWEVEDVHGNQGCDLVCRRGGEVKHVEVKGTIAGGTEVILTPSEVRHAREHPDAALFILSNIIVERSQDGTVTAAGGEKHLCGPCPVDDGTLVPLGFRYLVPPAGPVSAA